MKSPTGEPSQLPAPQMDAARQPQTHFQAPLSPQRAGDVLWPQDTAPFTLVGTPLATHFIQSPRSDQSQELPEGEIIDPALPGLTDRPKGMRKEGVLRTLAECVQLRLVSHHHDHPPGILTQPGYVLPWEPMCQAVKRPWCLREPRWSRGPSYQKDCVPGRAHRRPQLQLEQTGTLSFYTVLWSALQNPVPLK